MLESDAKYFSYGTVVRDKDGNYGHIVGFDRALNDHGHETILKVLWEDGKARSIHPGNIRTFPLT